MARERGGEDRWFWEGLRYPPRVWASDSGEALGDMEGTATVCRGAVGVDALGREGASSTGAMVVVVLWDRWIAVLVIWGVGEVVCWVDLCVL